MFKKIIIEVFIQEANNKFITQSRFVYKNKTKQNNVFFQQKETVKKINETKNGEMKEEKKRSENEKEKKMFTIEREINEK